MQEDRDEHVDNSVAASAASTDASSPHHITDTEDTGSDQSIRDATGHEDLETENKKNGNGEGYEQLDPHEVEEARLRAQHPSVYAKLQ